MGEMPCCLQNKRLYFAKRDVREIIEYIFSVCPFSDYREGHAYCSGHYLSCLNLDIGSA